MVKLNLTSPWEREAAQKRFGSVSKGAHYGDVQSLLKLKKEREEELKRQRDLEKQRQLNDFLSKTRERLGDEGRFQQFIGTLPEKKRNALQQHLMRESVAANDVYTNSNVKQGTLVDADQLSRDIDSLRQKQEDRERRIIELQSKIASYSRTPEEDEEAKRKVIKPIAAMRMDVIPDPYDPDHYEQRIVDGKVYRVPSALTLSDDKVKQNFKPINTILEDRFSQKGTIDRLDELINASLADYSYFIGDRPPPGTKEYDNAVNLALDIWARELPKSPAAAEAVFGYARDNFAVNVNNLPRDEVGLHQIGEQLAKTLEEKHSGATYDDEKQGAFKWRDDMVERFVRDFNENNGQNITATTKLQDVDGNEITAEQLVDNTLEELRDKLREPGKSETQVNMELVFALDYQQTLAQILEQNGAYQRHTPTIIGEQFDTGPFEEVALRIVSEKYDRFFPPEERGLLSNTTQLLGEVVRPLGALFANLRYASAAGTPPITIPGGKTVYGGPQGVSYEEAHGAQVDLVRDLKIPQTIQTGLVAGARAGEIPWNEITPWDTNTVSSELQKQWVEDVVTEFVIPENLLIGLAFAGAGVRTTRFLRNVDGTLIALNRQNVASLPQVFGTLPKGTEFSSPLFKQAAEHAGYRVVTKLEHPVRDAIQILANIVGPLGGTEPGLVRGLARGVSSVVDNATVKGLTRVYKTLDPKVRFLPSWSVAMKRVFGNRFLSDEAAFTLSRLGSEGEITADVWKHLQFDSDLDYDALQELSRLDKLEATVDMHELRSVARLEGIDYDNNTTREALVEALVARARVADTMPGISTLIKHNFDQVAEAYAPHLLLTKDTIGTFLNEVPSAFEAATRATLEPFGVRQAEAATEVRKTPDDLIAQADSIARELEDIGLIEPSAKLSAKGAEFTSGNLTREKFANELTSAENSLLLARAEEVDAPLPEALLRIGVDEERALNLIRTTTSYTAQDVRNTYKKLGTPGATDTSEATIFSQLAAPRPLEKMGKQALADHFEQNLAAVVSDDVADKLRADLARYKKGDLKKETVVKRVEKAENDALISYAEQLDLPLVESLYRLGVPPERLTKIAKSEGVPVSEIKSTFERLVSEATETVTDVSAAEARKLTGVELADLEKFGDQTLVDIINAGETRANELIVRFGRAVEAQDYDSALAVRNQLGSLIDNVEESSILLESRKNALPEEIRAIATGARKKAKTFSNEFTKTQESMQRTLRKSGVSVEDIKQGRLRSSEEIVEQGVSKAPITEKQALNEAITDLTKQMKGWEEVAKGKKISRLDEELQSRELAITGTTGVKKRRLADHMIKKSPARMEEVSRIAMRGRVVERVKETETPFRELNIESLVQTALETGNESAIELAVASGDMTITELRQAVASLRSRKAGSRGERYVGELLDKYNGAELYTQLKKLDKVYHNVNAISKRMFNKTISNLNPGEMARLIREHNVGRVELVLRSKETKTVAARSGVQPKEAGTSYPPPRKGKAQGSETYSVAMRKPGPVKLKGEEPGWLNDLGGQIESLQDAELYEGKFILSNAGRAFHATKTDLAQAIRNTDLPVKTYTYLMVKSDSVSVEFANGTAIIDVFTKLNSPQESALKKMLSANDQVIGVKVNVHARDGLVQSSRTVSPNKTEFQGVLNEARAGRIDSKLDTVYEESSGKIVSQGSREPILTESAPGKLQDAAVAASEQTKRAVHPDMTADEVRTALTDQLNAIKDTELLRERARELTLDLPDNLDRAKVIERITSTIMIWNEGRYAHVLDPNTIGPTKVRTALEAWAEKPQIVQRILSMDSGTEHLRFMGDGLLDPALINLNSWEQEVIARVLNQVETAYTDLTGSSVRLGSDLAKLFKSVDDGSVPTAITSNLRRIAKKYEVSTKGKTPNEVISELRALVDSGAEHVYVGRAMTQEAVEEWQTALDRHKDMILWNGARDEQVARKFADEHLDPTARVFRPETVEEAEARFKKLLKVEENAGITAEGVDLSKNAVGSVKFDPKVKRILEENGFRGATKDNLNDLHGKLRDKVAKVRKKLQPDERPRTSVSALTELRDDPIAKELGLTPEGIDLVDRVFVKGDFVAFDDTTINVLKANGISVKKNTKPSTAFEALRSKVVNAKNAIRARNKDSMATRRVIFQVRNAKGLDLQRSVGVTAEHRELLMHGEVRVIDFVDTGDEVRITLDQVKNPSEFGRELSYGISTGPNGRKMPKSEVPHMYVGTSTAGHVLDDQGRVLPNVVMFDNLDAAKARAVRAAETQGGTPIVHEIPAMRKDLLKPQGAASQVEGAYVLGTPSARFLRTHPVGPEAVAEQLTIAKALENVAPAEVTSIIESIARPATGEIPARSDSRDAVFSVLMRVKKPYESLREVAARYTDDFDTFWVVAMETLQQPAAEPVARTSMAGVRTNSLDREVKQEILQNIKSEEQITSSRLTQEMYDDVEDEIETQAKLRSGKPKEQLTDADRQGAITDLENQFKGGSARGIDDSPESIKERQAKVAKSLNERPTKSDLAQRLQRNLVEGGLNENYYRRGTELIEDPSLINPDSGRDAVTAELLHQIQNGRVTNFTVVGSFTDLDYAAWKKALQPGEPSVLIPVMSGNLSIGGASAPFVTGARTGKTAGKLTSTVNKRKVMFHFENTSAFEVEVASRGVSRTAAGKKISQRLKAEQRGHVVTGGKFEVLDPPKELPGLKIDPKTGLDENGVLHVRLRAVDQKFHMSKKDVEQIVRGRSGKEDFGKLADEAVDVADARAAGEDPPVTASGSGADGVPPPESPDGRQIGGDDPPGKGPPPKDPYDGDALGFNAFFHEIDKLEDIIADVAASTSNAMGWMSRRAGALPIVKSMLNYINPSVLKLDGSKSGDIIIGYLNKQVALSNQLAAWHQQMSHVERKNIDGIKLFNFVEGLEGTKGQRGEIWVRQDFIGSFHATPEAIVTDDIIELDGVETLQHFDLTGDLGLNSKRGAKLNDERMNYIKQVRKMLDDTIALERLHNVQPKEVIFAPGEAVDNRGYFPRSFLGFRDGRRSKNEKIRDMFKQIGGHSQDHLHHRYWNEMYDGLQAGARYADTIVDNVFARLRAGRTLVLDQELTQLLKNSGIEDVEIRRAISEVFHRKPSEDMNAAEDLASSFVRLGANINRELRPLMTSVDLGFIGLQWVNPLGRNPAAVFRAARIMFESLFTDAANYAQYIKRHIENGVLERALSDGLVWNQTELSWHEATSSGLFKRLPGIERFNVAYSNSLNYLNLELYKGIMGITEGKLKSGNIAIRRGMQAKGYGRALQAVGSAEGVDTTILKIFGQEGIHFSPKEMTSPGRQAAAVANKLTLRLNTSALGVSKGQQELEAFMFFAPRYYRAALGLLGDAVSKGGLQGAEARRSLGQLVGGFVLTNLIIEKATGQGLNLDPRDPDFLMIRVGGTYMGPGGPFVSFARFGTKIGKAIAEGNAGDFAKFDLRENPLFREWRGKLSPAFSLMLDVATDSTYSRGKLDLNVGGIIDDPLSEDSWEGMIDLAKERFVPFWVRGAMESASSGRPLWETVGAASGEFFAGIRTYPVSSRQLLEERFIELYKAEYGKDPKKDDDGNIGINFENPHHQQFIQNSDELLKLDEQAFEDIQRYIGFENDQLTEKLTSIETKMMEESFGPNWEERIATNDPFVMQQWGRLRGDIFNGKHAYILGDEREFREPEMQIGKLVREYFNTRPQDFETGDPQDPWDWDLWEIERNRVLDEIKALDPHAASAIEERARFKNEDIEALDKSYRDAKEIRAQADELPAYKGLTAEESTQVDEVLEITGMISTFASLVTTKSFTRPDVLGAMFLVNAEQQFMDPKIITTALLASKTATKALVMSTERQEMILDNPDLAIFWRSEWDELSRANQIQWQERYPNYPLPGAIKEADADADIDSLLQGAFNLDTDLFRYFQAANVAYQTAA